MRPTKLAQTIADKANITVREAERLIAPPPPTYVWHPDPDDDGWLVCQFERHVHGHVTMETRGRYRWMVYDSRAGVGRIDGGPASSEGAAKDAAEGAYEAWAR